MQNTIAVISLKQIVENVRAIQRAAGTPLIAVVKDDAYGHGAERVSLEIEPLVSAFAVSTADEGVSLRAAGVGKEILVLTPPLSEDEILRLTAWDLTASLTSLSVLNAVKRVSEKFGIKLRAHLAVNTGMNRYGFRPERVRNACRKADGVDIVGVYSHFYLPEDKREREAQTAYFEEAANTVREFFPNAVRHIAATGGILSGVKYDAVRAGLAIYGYLPEAFRGRIGVKPAMKLYATVAQSGTKLGGGLGYAKSEKGRVKIHTLRLGYGDGFFRSGGIKAEGKLCMDACVREGEERVGKTKLILDNVAAYAEEHGTTEYEVLVNISRKAVKIYG